MKKREKVELILNNYNELRGKMISLEYDLELNCDLEAIEYEASSGGKGGVPKSVVEEEVVRCIDKQRERSRLKLYQHTVKRINKSLDNLNKEERKVIEWLYFDGLTRDEASAEMFQEFQKGSVPTIDRRKRTALNKLVAMKFYNIPIKTMLNVS